jgi:CubicO group peptidase (beta-lactamase class C family)
MFRFLASCRIRAADRWQLHLFEPLGVDDFYWKKTPTGLVDAQSGLYLRPEDLAKFGYLYLADGIWGDRRILPEGWVEATMEPVAQTSGRPRRYGYHWWLLPYEPEAESSAYVGIGYGGQRLIVIPEHDLVAVFTGWNIYDKPGFTAEAALARVLSAVR